MMYITNKIVASLFSLSYVNLKVSAGLGVKSVPSLQISWNANRDYRVNNILTNTLQMQ
jgi:hypothetical protein